MSIIEFLEISVSLIFFVNKLLVLVGEKLERWGWLVGVVAAVLSIFYFYLIELYVFTALEFGLVVLMGYGFLPEKNKTSKTEKWIHIAIIVVMSALAYFVFSGLMTIYEFLSAVGMLIGTYYLLTHKKMQLGWLLYGLAHILAAVIGYDKQQEFFADFQIASVIVSAIGILQARKTKSSG